MKTTLIQDIAHLAGAEISAEEGLLTSGYNFPEGVKEAIEGKLEEEKKQATARIAETIVGAIKEAESIEADLVAKIREHRRQIASLKCDLKGLNHARKTAEEKQNYFFLLAMTGYLKPCEIAEATSEFPELFLNEYDEQKDGNIDE
jgi:hypothetical protein